MVPPRLGGRYWREKEGRGTRGLYTRGGGDVAGHVAREFTAGDAITGKHGSTARQRISLVTKIHLQILL
jgi:hypothetical protein